MTVQRDELVAHGNMTLPKWWIKDKDTLVVIDDLSRAVQHLRRGILRMLDRLHPNQKSVSSIRKSVSGLLRYRYESHGKFLLLPCQRLNYKETGKDYMPGEVYEACQRSVQEERPKNYVAASYDQFYDEQISTKYPRS